MNRQLTIWEARKTWQGEIRPLQKFAIVDPLDFLRVNPVTLNRLEEAPKNRIPYCFDFSKHETVYAYDISPLEAANATFHYYYLRENLSQLLVVPWEKLENNKGETQKKDPIFIFSPGRCGSTLLGKVIRELGAICVSEPDFLTQLVLFNLKVKRSSMMALETAKALEFALRDLMRPLEDSRENIVTIKLRSQCNRLPSILLSSMKNRARSVFVIREFQSWAESRTRAFGGAVERHFLSYVVALGCYEFLKRSTDCLLLNYEDMRNKDLAVTNSIATHIGLNETKKSVAAYASHSQSDTSLFSASKKKLPPEIKASISQYWQNNKPKMLIKSLGLDFLID